VLSREQFSTWSAPGPRRPGAPATWATAQLLITNGPTTECWQTTYTTATVNTAERFKAKGP